MNLSLSDPFSLLKDRPDVLVGRLRSGHSTVIRFNHRGDFLASGRLDGTVAIFDIETSGVARKLRGHTRQVQSLSWSSDDRFLLSASLDWKCILWDLEDGSRLRTVRFEAPAFIAELHPYNHLLFVVALFEDQPRLVDLTTETPSKRTLPSLPKRSEAERESGGEKQAAQDAKNTTTVAIFTKSGEHIVTGTNKGWVNVIDTATCETMASAHLTNALTINLRLGSTGRDALINSSDRCVRTVTLPDFASPNFSWDNFSLEVEHKFQDQINRQQWNHACFSSNGEYAAMTSYMNHIIYLWERTEKGSLVAVLEGPKEELSAVEWHPSRALVASIGVDTGRIYIWAVPTPQRWSALAPDFVEVEENVEYIEHEDEFDIQPIEEVHKRRLDREDEDLDVLSVDPEKAEGAEIGEFRMPVLLDIEASDSEDEVIAIGAGQFRRKSPGAGRDWGGDDGSAAPSGDEIPNGSRASIGNRRRRAE